MPGVFGSEHAGTAPIGFAMSTGEERTIEHRRHLASVMDDRPRARCWNHRRLDRVIAAMAVRKATRAFNS
jgi:hypothetical protein